MPLQDNSSRADGHESRVAQIYCGSGSGTAEYCSKAEPGAAAEQGSHGRWEAAVRRPVAQ
jgi:hypothetical protein